MANEIDLSLLSSMVLKTPCVRDRTEVETAVAAPRRNATLTVDSIRGVAKTVGVPASQFDASIMGETATPRRSSRDLRICRPRERRPLSVPTGHCSSRAASSWDFPSRWQSTMGSRYLPGRRLSSSWSRGRRSKS